MKIPPKAWARAAASVFAFLLHAASMRAADALAVPAWMAKPGEIEATLVPDKASIMQGEPVYATLTLKNNSGRDLMVSLYTSYGYGLLPVRPETGRWQRDAIQLTAVDKEGRKAPAFQRDAGTGGEDYSGPGKSQKFPAAGKLSYRVCVPEWVVFDHPGGYTLTTAPLLYTIKMKQTSGGEMQDGIDKVAVTATAGIEVTPADSAKMGAVIDELVKKASGADNAETAEAVKMLDATPDPRVVPWLLSEVKKDRSQNQGPAIAALARMDDDSALAALEDALESATTDELRVAICSTLLHSTHPAAVAWLKGRGDDKNDTVAWFAKASKGIQASLAPEKPAILPGEPIYATLTVTNNSDREFMIHAHNDGEDGSGMEKSIKVTATGKDGVKVPAPPFPAEAAGRKYSSMRTLVENVALAPGKSIEIRLCLPWRVVLDKPGSYTLSAAGELQFITKDSRGGANAAIPVSATAPLTVLPEDKEKMGKMIDDLEKLATSVSHTIYNGEVPQGYKESMDAAFRLNWISDERVIPYYRKMMRSENFGEWISAMRALSKFNNDDALDSLKDGLELPEVINPASHQLDKNSTTALHIAACNDLMASPHPGAIPYLLTQRKNPDLQVRIKVMQAVATRLPAKEAIPILQEMQDDPEHWVGDYARRYLQTIQNGNVGELKKWLGVEESGISGDL